MRKVRTAPMGIESPEHFLGEFFSPFLLGKDGRHFFLTSVECPALLFPVISRSLNDSAVP